MKYFLFEFIISPRGHIPPVSSEQIVYDQGPVVLWTPEGPEICSPKYYYCGSALVSPSSPLNVVIIQMRFRAIMQIQTSLLYIMQKEIFGWKSKFISEEDKQETFIERIQSWELFNYYPIPNYKWAEYCG